jgi:hypothetical protein
MTMTINFKSIWLVFVVVFSATQLPAADNINPATMEKYRQVKAALEQMFKAKEGIYARDVLEGAQRNLAKAQEGIETRKEKTASQTLDMVSLQIEQAKAKAEEKEAAEKTAVTRAKVDKLEQRLANILTGKGDDK